MVVSFPLLAGTAHANGAILAQTVSLSPGQHQIFTFTAPATGVVQIVTKSGSSQDQRDYSISNSSGNEEFGTNMARGNATGQNYNTIDNFSPQKPGGVYSINVWFDDTSVSGSFALLIRSYDPTLPSMQLDKRTLITIPNPGEYRLIKFTAPKTGVVQIITQSVSTTSTSNNYGNYTIIDGSGNPEWSNEFWLPPDGSWIRSTTLQKPGEVYFIKIYFDFLKDSFTTGSFYLTIGDAGFKPTNATSAHVPLSTSKPSIPVKTPSPGNKEESNATKSPKPNPLNSNDSNTSNLPSTISCSSQVCTFGALDGPKNLALINGSASDQNYIQVIFQFQRGINLAKYFHDFTITLTEYNNGQFQSNNIAGTPVVQNVNIQNVDSSTKIPGNTFQFNFGGVYQDKHAYVATLRGIPIAGNTPLSIGQSVLYPTGESGICQWGLGSLLSLRDGIHLSDKAVNDFIDQLDKTVSRIGGNSKVPSIKVRDLPKPLQKDLFNSLNEKGFFEPGTKEIGFITSAGDNILNFLGALSPGTENRDTIHDLTISFTKDKLNSELNKIFKKAAPTVLGKFIDVQASSADILDLYSFWQKSVSNDTAEISSACAHR